MAWRSALKASILFLRTISIERQRVKEKEGWGAISLVLDITGLVMEVSKKGDFGKGGKRRLVH